MERASVEGTGASGSGDGASSELGSLSVRCIFGGAEHTWKMHELDAQALSRISGDPVFCSVLLFVVTCCMCCDVLLRVTPF